MCRGPRRHVSGRFKMSQRVGRKSKEDRPRWAMAINARHTAHGCDGDRTRRPVGDNAANVATPKVLRRRRRRCRSRCRVLATPETRRRVRSDSLADQSAETKRNKNRRWYNTRFAYTTRGRLSMSTSEQK